MNRSRYCQVEFALHWQSRDATHTDRRYLQSINFWRDYLPGHLAEEIDKLGTGDALRCAIDINDWVDAYDRTQVQTLRNDQFRREVRPGLRIEPQQGRFYPRNLATGLRGGFSEDRRPMRVLRCTPEELTVDLNHPLAGFGAELEARIIGVQNLQASFGGSCIDIAQQLTNDGPGMQAALAEGETDFYSGEPFLRLDPRDDAEFYAGARLTQHIDSCASENIGEIYRRFLRPGMRVLDLMSSWVSHLPEDCADIELLGLGMNEEELRNNSRLTAYRVCDLNRQAQLPFPDRDFDAVLCTVSVEYLVNPFAVFGEVARVLKPGAPFVLTFSDRWFPTKAIRLWTEMHAFERMGLVLDYLRRAGDFVHLGSESLRGLPRPKNDSYADQLRFSDPVFAVWGCRAQ